MHTMMWLVYGDAGQKLRVGTTCDDLIIDPSERGVGRCLPAESGNSSVLCVQLCGPSIALIFEFRSTIVILGGG